MRLVIQRVQRASVTIGGHEKAAIGKGLLILIGIIYIVEILSVVLQVTYFKISHGKRIFKMAPIHHHFEMCGWNENKICFVFSGVTLFAGIIGVLLAVFGC